MTGCIIILTGAGISAESGLGTFRDAEGLWVQHRVEDVATPEGFARDPSLVHAFYNARRAQAAQAQPNDAHLALATLQADYAGEIVLVTQNVDGLHEAAGSPDVIHMHGQLSRALCHACGHKWDAPEQMQSSDLCARCNAPATRPDVVWFGETPYAMHVISQALSKATQFVAIGTSGEVYPAAGFVQEARARGAHTVEINLETGPPSPGFARKISGKASETVPAWVNQVLGR